MAEFKFPTEEVELPSKGLLYPEDSPLSSGKVEIKYMTAKEEDILTNQNYIQKGIVLDKLLESVVISKINLDDLIIGNHNDDPNGIDSGASFVVFGKTDGAAVELSAIASSSTPDGFVINGGVKLVF